MREHILLNGKHHHSQCRSVKSASIGVLEHILCCDGCDVDPQNRIDKATPLHISLEIKDPQLRYQIVESLLDAGADTRYMTPIHV